MVLLNSETGICLLDFADSKNLDRKIHQLQKLLKAEINQRCNELSDLVKKEIKSYFAGETKNFTVSIHWTGTSFQNTIWQNLCQIPYGTTQSYNQQAMAMKRPSAIRAIARANGANKMAIIVPCHRVIGKDGKLIGYSGGLHRKRWLIDFERKNRYGVTELFETEPILS